MPPRFVAACSDALGVDAATTDPRLAVLTADARVLGGLPPTFLVTGGRECFRGDAHRLHDRLGRIGVYSQHTEVPGHLHDFVLFTKTAASRAVLRQVADFVTAAGDDRFRAFYGA